MADTLGHHLAAVHCHQGGEPRQLVARLVKADEHWATIVPLQHGGWLLAHGVTLLYPDTSQHIKTCVSDNYIQIMR